MAASAEKIKELLGNGLSNEVVATAVGVHPSYVSQLMADEQFASDVINLRTQQLASASNRDRSWDGLEDKMLNSLHDIVDSKMVYKPADVAKILAMANAAKRRGASSQQSMTTHNHIVTLRLPDVVTRAYRQNTNGEVIEVTADNGAAQTLVTMPASALMQKLSEQHQGNPEYDKVRRYLPASGAEKNS